MIEDITFDSGAGLCVTVPRYTGVSTRELLAAGCTLTMPTLRLVGDEVWAPAAEYELRQGRRVLKGWTLGQVHPLADNTVRPPLDEFAGASGQGYAFLEGIHPVGTHLAALAKAICARGLLRGAERDGWVVRVTDIDEAEIERLCGVRLDSTGTQESLQDDLPKGIDAQIAMLHAMTGPGRHVPLRAAVEEIVGRSRWPARVVAVFGAIHLPGIERDVWAPLGFQRLGIHWSPVARLLLPATTGVGEGGVTPWTDPEPTPTDPTEPRRATTP